MKITLLIVSVVLCIGLATSASNAPRQMRMFANAKRVLERRQEGEKDDRRCFGAKCDCRDFELLQGFVATMGNLVTSCEIARLWRESASLEKKQEGFDFYAAGCEYLEEIGEDYEEGKETDIYTCCDVHEYLVAFHCLNTYMSLAEMDFARNVYENKGGALVTAKLVTDLESGMKHQCDSIYKSPNCLVWGMTGNDNVNTCLAGDEGETEEEGEEEGGNGGKRVMTLDEKIELLLKGIKSIHK